MGPSGSGKSTFLNVAAGLDRPTSGTVALGDTDLGQLGERPLTIVRRERIGVVFPGFNLLPSLTVAQNRARRLARGDPRGLGTAGPGGPVGADAAGAAHAPGRGDRDPRVAPGGARSHAQTATRRLRRLLC